MKYLFIIASMTNIICLNVFYLSKGSMNYILAFNSAVFIFAAMAVSRKEA